jgi:hypothetical protein
MGGKKASRSVGNVISKSVSAGMVSTDGTGTAQKLASGKGLEMGDAINAFGGASFNETTKAITPEMPKLPDQDLAADEAEAEARMRASISKNLGDKKLGLSSTILGGSYGDNANLKKKKLLGE